MVILYAIVVLVVMCLAAMLLGHARAWRACRRYHARRKQAHAPNRRACASVPKPFPLSSSSAGMLTDFARRSTSDLVSRCPCRRYLVQSALRDPCA